VSIGETVNFRITLKHTPEAARYDEGTAPPPEMRRSKIGTAALVSPEQLAALPAEQRAIDSLAALGPFTSRDNSSRVVIDGQPRSIAFLTDGILTTNTYYGNRAGVAPHLSPDSVQEFQVLAGNSAPEFGAAMGGIVNAATRGGTETLHGSIYDYLD